MKPIFSRHRSTLLALASLSASCAVDSEPPAGLGRAVAAISIVPSNVQCVEITVAGTNTVTTRTTVAPGASATIPLLGLPVGDVTVTGMAYRHECSHYPALGDALYVSLPTRATLVQGVSSMIALSLRRAAGATVTVDFNDRVGAKCPTNSTADCDGDPSNGCEVDLTTSNASCGACGRTCATARGYVCVASACVATNNCGAGYANCDDAPGCETDTQTSHTNCGGCGLSCALPHTVNSNSLCQGGVCQVPPLLNCQPGWVDCDGNRANGCEGALDANCGRCGNACPAAQVCVSGVCRRTNTSSTSARTIDISTGSSVDVPFTTAGASGPDTANCTGGAPLPSAWFRFTLAQREVVYADTFGTGFPTVLGLGVDAASFRWVGQPQSCGSGTHCAASGVRVVATLSAGSYFVAVSSASLSETGSGTLHLQHLPVGNGAVAPLEVPPTAGCFQGSLSGSTSGTGSMSACADASGPEASYWWLT
jgi:hypothetical protein